MTMRTRAIVGLLILVLAATGGTWYFLSPKHENSHLVIRYGITPFQDSALPVVASKAGQYEQNGLDVRLVDLGWSDVPLALASRSIDVAIYNFDSYMSASEQLKKGGVDVVFYAPLYVFNGQAIMVHGNVGIAPVGDLKGLSDAQRIAKIKAAMEQLRGKRIGVTEGTDWEHVVLAALAVAGMDPKKDVQLINARPEDNLAAFISGDLDAFSAGLTERIQAERHGGIELLVGPTVIPPVIDGLVVRRDFAAAHPQEIQKLIDVWFDTVRYVQSDVQNHSAPVRDYLRGKASVTYSPEEYAIAWTFQDFAKNRSDAVHYFLDEKGPYYWKPIWQARSQFLLGEKKIAQPIPLTEFLGDSLREQ